MEDDNLDQISGILKFASHKLNDKKAAERERDKAFNEKIPANLIRTNDGTSNPLTFQYTSASGGTYQISVLLEYHAGQTKPPDFAKVTCTCPAAKKSPLCKHGMAALLWRLSQSHGEPSSAAAAAQPAGLEAGPSEPAGPPAPAAPKTYGFIKVPGSRLLNKIFLRDDNQPNANREPREKINENAQEEEHREPSPSPKKPAPKKKKSSKRWHWKPEEPQAQNEQQNGHNGGLKRWMTGEEMVLGSDEELLAAAQAVLRSRGRMQPQRPAPPPAPPAAPAPAQPPEIDLTGIEDAMEVEPPAPAAVNQPSPSPAAPPIDAANVDAAPAAAEEENQGYDSTWALYKAMCKGSMFEGN